MDYALLRQPFFASPTASNFTQTVAESTLHVLLLYLVVHCTCTFTVLVLLLKLVLH